MDVVLKIKQIIAYKEIIIMGLKFFGQRIIKVNKINNNELGKVQKVRRYWWGNQLLWISKRKSMEHFHS